MEILSTFCNRQGAYYTWGGILYLYGNLRFIRLTDNQGVPLIQSTWKTTTTNKFENELTSWNNPE